MQIFAIAVFVIVCVCALFDFKRTVLIWMPVQFLFNSQIAVRYASPGMALNIAVDFGLLAIFWLKLRGHEREFHLNEEPFLFTPLLVLSILSFLFTTIWAIVPLSAGVVATVKYFLITFSTIYIYQKVLNDEQDIRLCVRTCAVVIALMTLLGLYESIMKDNPWLDVVYMLSPHDETTRGRMWYVPPFISASGTVQMRFGLVRAYSFRGIHIDFGNLCVMFSYLAFTLLKNRWHFGISKTWWIILGMLLCSGVFLANSKAGMVGFVFLLLAFAKMEHVMRPIVIIPVALLVVVLLVYVPELLDNYVSLFDEKVAEEGGGSSVALRKMQWQVVKRLFNMNPLFGNGIGSIELMKKRVGFEDILGAESAYFKILPERGILGLVCYFYCYVLFFKIMRQYIPLKETFFFLLALFVIEGVSGTISVACYGFIVLMVRRCYQIARANTNAQLSEEQSPAESSPSHAEEQLAPSP